MLSQTDTQLLRIEQARAPLPPENRGLTSRASLESLGDVEIGDGVVSRAARQGRQSYSSHLNLPGRRRQRCIRS